MQVPVYGNRQVKPEPLPGQKLTPQSYPEAFGGGNSMMVFGAARGLAKEAEEIATAEKGRANQTILNGALNKAFAHKDDLLYGKSGFTTLRGLDPTKVQDQYLKNWEDGISKIREGLNSDVVDMFDRALLHHNSDLRRTMMHHSETERRTYDKNETQGVLQNLEKDALRSSDDFKSVQFVAGAQEATFRKWAEREGMPTALVDARVTEMRGDTLYSVLGKMLDDGKYQQGKLFFTENQGKFGKNESDAAKIVKERGLLDEANALAREIYRTSANDDEAQERARKVADEDAKKGSVVLAGVRDMIHQERDRKTQEVEGASSDAWKALLDNPGNTVRERVGELLYQNLPDETLRSLEIRLEHLKRKTEPETDPIVYTELMGYDAEKLASISDADFTTKYINSLNPHDWRYALALRKNAREDLNKFRSVFSTNEMILSTLAGAEVAGITPQDTFDTIRKDEDKAAAVMEFKKRVDDKIFSLGHPPNPKELKEIIQDEALNHWRKVRVRITDAPSSIPGLQTLRQWHFALTPEAGIPTMEVPFGELSEEAKRKAFIPPEDIKEEDVRRLYEYAQAVHFESAQMGFDEWKTKMGKRVGKAYLVGLTWANEALRNKRIKEIWSEKD